MNILILFSRVLPPLVVLSAFAWVYIAQAEERSQYRESRAELAPANAAASKATAAPAYKRYELGKGRLLFVNSEKSFESYDNWIIDQSSFEFSKRQRALSKRDKKRLQKMLLKAREEQTKSFGGTIVTAGSPCTLRQRLHLKNVRLKSSERGGSQVSFSRSFGSTTVVAEIRDALSDEVVFIYKEDVALGGGVSGGPDARINRLAKALRIVMVNAHKILVHALPLHEERIATRNEFGCSGQLGKNAISLRAERARLASQ
ncbi:MAG: DUF3313 domain-containing protein [Gammaproteobacteria bacterium]|nr:DUF3313 domain-containing protein [Gammaproteobacteria bacterium]MBT8150930.1 DUF3313 domain-containing protein [Gammaproteobacteria bacterium]NND38670.1 hypothetical protein [Pseudomonadales bacterium]NNL11351.1 hypothetical protein [Pseudomonadales bacterium]NNM11026.1 hypothetical protein [Pseudomonadales bacterium]